MTGEILCRLFDLTVDVLSGPPPLLRYELRTDLPPGVSVGIYVSRQVSPESIDWELLEFSTELAHVEQSNVACIRGTLDIWAADHRLVATSATSVRHAKLYIGETVEIGARVYCYQPQMILGENNRLLAGPLVTTFYGDNVIDVRRQVVVPLAPAIKAAGYC